MLIETGNYISTLVNAGNMVRGVFLININSEICIVSCQCTYLCHNKAPKVYCLFT